MSYSFYDWNQAVQQRNEFVENRLRDGSPVVAVAYDGGIVLLTLRGTQQRKLFEVYDRLIMGALGRQSDIESVRIAAIDSAHREGFERSPDDVSIQRLVGFGLSPAVKRVYNDQQAIPLTFRGLFAEMHGSPDDDLFFILGYDGEFRTQSRFAVAAGTAYAEGQAESFLQEQTIASLEDALKTALHAWGIGKSQLAEKSTKKEDDDELEEADSEAKKVADDPAQAVRDAIAEKLTVEAAILSRSTPRESKFRLLRADELEGVLAPFR